MQKFSTPTTISAALNIPAGRIQLIAAQRGNTTVDVVPADASKSRDVKAAQQTVVEFADGALNVTTPVTNRVLGASGAVEVTVQLPAGSRVEVSAASAEVRGVGVLGDVTFDGSHGAIKLDEAASVQVNTHAGDVVVGRLNGPGQITTGKGDIRIDEAVRGALDLRTEAGDVSVVAGAGVSASLDAGTTLGRVHNALRNDGGEPELTIRATTALGDIDARSS